jgi:SAM-dependent methyltransferase
VLDIGCGTGDIIGDIEFDDYIGLDPSPRYIESARSRAHPRTRFECANVETTGDIEIPPRTIVIAIGVLHHLDDNAATSLLELAVRSLEPGGRFVAIDPGLVDGQPWIARQLIIRDRGANVRTPEETTRLVSIAFPATEVHCRHDLLRLPYTHVVVESSL